MDMDHGPDQERPREDRSSTEEDWDSSPSMHHPSGLSGYSQRPHPLSSPSYPHHETIRMYDASLPRPRTSPSRSGGHRIRAWLNPIRPGSAAPGPLAARVVSSGSSIELELELKLITTSGGASRHRPPRSQAVSGGIERVLTSDAAHVSIEALTANVDSIGSVRDEYQSGHSPSQAVSAGTRGI